MKKALPKEIFVTIGDIDKEEDRPIYYLCDTLKEAAASRADSAFPVGRYTLCQAGRVETVQTLVEKSGKRTKIE